MARIRTIKPGFWTDEDLSCLPEATHMLAAALLNYADDDGYFNANPALVKATCCPLRDPSVSVHDSLKLLAKSGWLKLGTAHDGKRYGLIVNFSEHQVINRKTDSKIKDMDISWDVLTEDSVSPHELLTDPSHPEGKGREGKGKEREEDWRAVRAAEGGNFLAGNGAALVGEPMPHELPVNGPPAKPETKPLKPYAYAGEVIRLTHEQFGKWEEAFPSVDLRCELQARDDWLCEQEADIRKKWFHSTSSFLAGRERRAKEDQRKKRELEDSIYRGVI